MMSDPEKERRAQKAIGNVLRRHLINAPSETVHELQQACAELLRLRIRLYNKTLGAVRIASGQANGRSAKGTAAPVPASKRRPKL
jgi:hypothetical protein